MTDALLSAAIAGGYLVGVVAPELGIFAEWLAR